MNTISKYLVLIILGLSFSLNAQQKQLTNQLIWASREFNPENVYGVESMNDGIHFTVLESDYQAKTTQVDKYTYVGYKKVATVVSSTELVVNGKPLSIDEYHFSGDERKLLIATEQESIYRHSSKAFYYIYDIATKKITPLSDEKLGKQRLAEFSPDGTMIAFVRDNNLFLKYLISGDEIQVTMDGKINEVINGAVDWVYEEEFSFHKGFYWSPNSANIGFYRFDESHVKEYQMEIYGTLYPEHYRFKYPKAGEDNSKISVKVFNVHSRKTDDFDLGENEDIYVPRMAWANDGTTLCVQRLNRLQNELELLVGDFNPGRKMIVPVSVRSIYKEQSSTYIDVHDFMEFSADNKRILWASEQDGFNHLYWIDVETGRLTQITSGQWEVTDVYGWDQKNNRIYFQAAKNHPTQREVYSISGDGSVLTLLSLKSGTNRAEFSNSFRYFILFHSDANTPFTVSIVDNNLKGKKAAPYVIKDNAGLKKRMTEYAMSPQTFFTVKNAEGTELNAWMIKPLRMVDGKKYPLLMFVYGGPGHNTVNDAWGYGNYFWFQSLAQQGYVVVSVDARGTGYRGRDFKHSTYLQLGKYETEDQIHAAKELGKLDYIDAGRIGIFGWSYGGYMSSLCITKGADVFKSAIAVAPVTNWRYYDNVYTERFMRTPQENGKNYDDNSPINHVSKLKGNYLLIHGSADDNVHFQNAMEMNNALVNANKQFEFMAYPNKDHGIYGGYTRWHLYDKMTNFLLKNL
jgi:dipeptidyl-peptidase 4